MTFKIEKNVPMPETPAKYPFADMEVGDSFFAENRTPSQLQNSAGTIKKSKGFKFAARAIDGGARIWRTE